MLNVNSAQRHRSQNLLTVLINLYKKDFFPQLSNLLPSTVELQWLEH